MPSGDKTTHPFARSWKVKVVSVKAKNDLDVKVKAVFGAYGLA